MGKLTEVLLPDFGDGESGALEAIVSYWPVGVGDVVREGDDLLEIVTDKASFVVPSPCGGILRERRVSEDDRVRVGDVIALMET